VLRREHRQDIVDKALVTRVSRVDRHLAGLELIGYFQDSSVSGRRPVSAKSDVPHFAASLRFFHGLDNTIALALLDVSWRLDAVHLPKIEVIGP
jgi:hypothetical protein